MTMNRHHAASALARNSLQPPQRRGLSIARAAAPALAALCLLALLLTACDRGAPPEQAGASPTSQPARSPRAAASGGGASPGAAEAGAPASGRTWRVVHVFVALCDNANQGIHPVPAALGNGQDPENNLYWGAQYGVATFLRRGGHWRLLDSPILKAAPRPAGVLRRIAFRNRGAGPVTYVLADAYDGARMADALRAFLRAAAGRDRTAVGLWPGRPALGAGGAADLVCFVGHNGLMDTALADQPARAAGATGPAGAIVLACRSDMYFAAPLARAGCQPLVTTHGLMAPEAYVLDAALRAWIAGGVAPALRQAAATAYATYQRCSPRAAANLFGARR